MSIFLRTIAAFSFTYLQLDLNKITKAAYHFSYVSDRLLYDLEDFIVIRTQ